MANVIREVQEDNNPQNRPPLQTPVIRQAQGQPQATFQPQTQEQRPTQEEFVEGMIPPNTDAIPRVEGDSVTPIEIPQTEEYGTGLDSIDPVTSAAVNTVPLQMDARNQHLNRWEANRLQTVNDPNLYRPDISGYGWTPSFRQETDQDISEFLEGGLELLRGGFQQVETPLDSALDPLENVIDSQSLQRLQANDAGFGERLATEMRAFQGLPAVMGGGLLRAAVGTFLNFNDVEIPTWARFTPPGLVAAGTQAAVRGVARATGLDLDDAEAREEFLQRTYEVGRDVTGATYGADRSFTAVTEAQAAGDVGGRQWGEYGYGAVGFGTYMLDSIGNTTRAGATDLINTLFNNDPRYTRRESLAALGNWFQGTATQTGALGAARRGEEFSFLSPEDETGLAWTPVNPEQSGINLPDWAQRLTGRDTIFEFMPGSGTALGFVLDTLTEVPGEGLLGGIAQQAASAGTRAGARRAVRVGREAGEEAAQQALESAVRQAADPEEVARQALENARTLDEYAEAAARPREAATPSQILREAQQRRVEYQIPDVRAIEPFVPLQAPVPTAQQFNQFFPPEMSVTNRSTRQLGYGEVELGVNLERLGGARSVLRNELEELQSIRQADREVLQNSLPSMRHPLGVGSYELGTSAERILDGGNPFSQLPQPDVAAPIIQRAEAAGLPVHRVDTTDAIPMDVRTRPGVYIANGGRRYDLVPSPVSRPGTNIDDMLPDYSGGASWMSMEALAERAGVEFRGDSFETLRQMGMNYRDWDAYSLYADGRGFNIINDYLRYGRVRGESIENALNSTGATLELIDEHLAGAAQSVLASMEKLPPAPGGIHYRGVRDMGLNVPEPGQIVTNRGIGSWTGDAQMAEDFLFLDEAGRDMPGAIFVSVENTPDSLLRFSPNVEQAEALQLPNTAMRVNAVLDSTVISDGAALRQALLDAGVTEVEEVAARLTRISQEVDDFRVVLMKPEGMLEADQIRTVIDPMDEARLPDSFYEPLPQGIRELQVDEDYGPDIARGYDVYLDDAELQELNVKLDELDELDQADETVSAADEATPPPAEASEVTDPARTNIQEAAPIDPDTLETLRANGYNPDDLNVESYRGASQATFLHSPDSFVKVFPANMAPEFAREVRNVNNAMALLEGTAAEAYFPRVRNVGNLLIEFEELAGARPLWDVIRAGEGMDDAMWGRFIKMLDDLREEGIVHGDLHPRNVMVMPDDSLRLIDMDRLHQTRGGMDDAYDLFYFGYAATRWSEGRGFDFDTSPLIKYLEDTYADLEYEPNQFTAWFEAARQVDESRAIRALEPDDIGRAVPDAEVDNFSRYVQRFTERQPDMELDNAAMRRLWEGYNRPGASMLVGQVDDLNPAIRRTVDTWRGRDAAEAAPSPAAVTPSPARALDSEPTASELGRRSTLREPSTVESEGLGDLLYLGTKVNDPAGFPVGYQSARSPLGNGWVLSSSPDEAAMIAKSAPADDALIDNVSLSEKGRVYPVRFRATKPYDMETFPRPEVLEAMESYITDNFGEGFLDEFATRGAGNTREMLELFDEMVDELGDDVEVEGQFFRQAVDRALAGEGFDAKVSGSQVVPLRSIDLEDSIEVGDGSLNEMYLNKSNSMADSLSAADRAEAAKARMSLANSFEDDIQGALDDVETQMMEMMSERERVRWEMERENLASEQAAMRDFYRDVQSEGEMSMFDMDDIQSYGGCL